MSARSKSASGSSLASRRLVFKRTSGCCWIPCAEALRALPVSLPVAVIGTLGSAGAYVRTDIFRPHSQPYVHDAGDVGGRAPHRLDICAHSPSNRRTYCSGRPAVGAVSSRRRPRYACCLDNVSNT